MKHRILALFPASFQENPVHFQALGLGFVYVTMAILQLFTYETFHEVTLSFGFPGGNATAIVLAVLIPLAEIMALPYLLSMKLPPKVYAVSRASVLVAAGLWVLVACWTNITGNNQDSLGIFGSTLYTPNQWWSVIFVGLIAWAAWLIYSAKPRRAHRLHIAA